MSGVIVVTASLPERVEFRAECVESVKRQTLQPVAHLIVLDYERRGPAAMLNMMLPAMVASGAEWVAQLADDDLIDADHLEKLVAHATAEDADVVYSWCRVEGRGAWNPNATFDADLIRAQNYIPATTLIRTSLCAELGWRSDAMHGFEDWDFWLRSLDAGVKFACLEEETWTYRFHGSNLSTG